MRAPLSAVWLQVRIPEVLNLLAQLGVAFMLLDPDTANRIRCMYLGATCPILSVGILRCCAENGHAVLFLGVQATYKSAFQVYETALPPREA